MSFWQETLCTPTWKSYLESWMYSYPSKLIDISNHLIKVNLPPGLVLRQATAADVEQLPEFWTRYFSESTRCIVPLLHIQKQVSLFKWVILVIVKEGVVIGSLVRRVITNLHMREVVWRSAGVIDYFCIHPAYRKKGIGRRLLAAIHNMAEKPIQPHLMLLEGFQLSIPPCSAGVFLSKQCQHSNLAIREVTEGHATIWKDCVKGNDVWSDWSASGSGEVSLWQIGSSYVAIWNTFHYSIPDGAKIGIIVGYTGDALEKVGATVSHGYGILLLGTPVSETFSHSGWNLDSPFQWISYNTTNGFISGSFPALCF